MMLDHHHDDRTLTRAADAAVYVTVAGSGELLVLRARPVHGCPSRSDQRDELSEVQRLQLGGAPMPMAFSPRRERLYVVDRSAACLVHTLAIEPRDGTLTPLGTAKLAGNIAYAATTRDGRFLLTASYGDDFVSVNAIDDQGVAREVLQRVPTPRHAHAILPDPARDDAVWVTCLGADVILKLGLDVATGRLDETPLWTHVCRAQSGPRHALFHPNRRWCFLINELDGTVDTLALSDSPGSLPRPTATASLMDEGFTQAPWSAELRLSADGEWLFASERRAGTLTAIRVDPSSGALDVTHRLVVDATPRSFAVSPDGTRLYVVSQQSGQLSTICVDKPSGHMRIMDTMLLGASPTWVEVLALADS